MISKKTVLLVIILFAAGAAAPSGLLKSGRAEVITREQIEADWLRQREVRKSQSVTSGKNVTCQQDAAGGCDGVKNGKWGFHTENEERPWWQIDLGKPTALGQVVVYNRCDLAERNSRLMVLVSDDAKNFKQVYQHNGTTFYGYTDSKPLVVKMDDVTARYVRLQLPGRSYFHLDEVEIYTRGSKENIALGKAATQSSTSQWSERHAQNAPKGGYETNQIIQRGLKLAENLRLLGADVDAQEKALRQVAGRLKRMGENASDANRQELYFEALRAVRRMALSNPLLDFDTILFAKRAPGMFPHICDQYYGWWSRPGGGIYLLKDFKSDTPRLQCLTNGWPAGNFLRPELSYNGKKVLFAWCKYYRHVAGNSNKVDKEKLPEDSFYHLFEMNVDGGGVRQLTSGYYDDFDGRYLPSGEIVFLSTRKGTWLQAGKASAAATRRSTCPDSYVRCGGDSHRPVAVFTLHAMDASGKNLRAISAFENFEWTPSVAHDGRILYARWDYIDRFNGHFMSLWSTNPDGTNPQLVYGNFTKKPQCIFEAQPIPNSRKLVFTGTAHHSITGGSLALLDRRLGTEYERPLTRLTPEVCFPEAEGWPNSYYAAPYPLSEQHFLVGWSDRKLPAHNLMRIDDPANPDNAMGLYVYDSFGNLNLLYRDPNISSMYPIAVRARQSPPVRSDNVDWEGPQEGRFLVQDIYQGLGGILLGSVNKIRIVGVPPKTQPLMNSPNLGVSSEDPGKFVLGTVPVEEDGSAYFRVPSGVSVFFQLLDDNGFAVQTMRSLTYVQPNQTISCIGCHESRELAPEIKNRPLASLRAPSRIEPGPEGSWPLRFVELVQPVLDKFCVSCHKECSYNEKARHFVLTQPKSYENLLSFADNDLKNLVFERDSSAVEYCPSRQSKLLTMLTDEKSHEGVRLDADSFNRLVTWIDTYAQRNGAFSERQEQELIEFRVEMAAILDN
ncbi:MAG: discoidin domain-containing protein [Phycisphaerae bacterium]|nr:discoidin domain-containing protein [Phycisphaerae bacterium]